MSIAAAKSGEWLTRDSGRRGRNGKAVREILLASLPAELQKRYAERQRAAQNIELVSLETEFSEQAKPDVESRLTETLMRYPADVRDAFLNEARRLAGIVDRYRNAGARTRFLP